MNKIAIKLLAIISLSLVVACGEIETETTPKVQAKQLLNEGRYDDAISMLTELKKQDAADHELNLLLASAYAGKSQFNIVDAYSAFRPFIEVTTKKASLVESAPSETPASANIDLEELEGRIVKITTNFASRFQSFDNIPYIQGRQRAQLVEALLVLRQVPQKSTYFHRARSYAAIINALQFANLLRDAMNQPKENTSPVALVCSIDLHELAKNVDRAAGYLVDSVDDLRAAYAKYSKPIPRGLLTLQKDSKVVVDFFAQNRSSTRTTEVLSNFSKRGICD